MTSQSCQNKQLYDPIRKKWVSATPEEIVRQSLILEILEKGYKKSQIGVEIALNRLPHLQGVSLPSRRADLCVFWKQEPLILVECKAVPLTKAMYRQLVGYNAYVRAPVLVLRNEIQTLTWVIEDGQWKELSSFPKMDDLGLI